MDFQETLNNYLISKFELIKDEYKWDFSTKNLPIVYSKDFKSNYQNSLDLRLLIHEEIKSNKIFSEELQIWYVTDWGGVVIVPFCKGHRSRNVTQPWPRVLVPCRSRFANWPRFAHRCQRKRPNAMPCLQWYRASIWQFHGCAGVSQGNFPGRIWSFYKFGASNLSKSLSATPWRCAKSCTWSSPMRPTLK